LLSTSLIPSTGTHLRHFWHLPWSICDRSFFAAFGRATIWKEEGGANGRPVAAEMPIEEQDIKKK